MSLPVDPIEARGSVSFKFKLVLSVAVELYNDRWQGMDLYRCKSWYKCTQMELYPGSLYNFLQLSTSAVVTSSHVVCTACQRFCRFCTDTDAAVNTKKEVVWILVQFLSPGSAELYQMSAKTQ